MAKQPGPKPVRASKPHPVLPEVKVPSISSEPEDMEVRVRSRIAKLTRDRDAYIGTAQVTINKMQNDLNDYILQSNETLAGYNATIDELNRLIGKDPEGTIEEKVQKLVEMRAKVRDAGSNGSS